MFNNERVQSAFEAVVFAMTPPCDPEEKATFMELLHDDSDYDDLQEQIESHVDGELFDELTGGDMAELIRRLRVKFPPSEDGCVYCGDEAVYECDGCKEADNGDGGKMCVACSHEHGHEVGDEFLCGGCFESREDDA